jgi:tight adherence protein B
VSGAALPAFLCGATALAAIHQLLAGIAPVALSRAPALAGRVAGLVDAVMLAGREGRDPGAADRRRLLLAGAALAFICGTALGGPALAAILATAAPAAVARGLRARRERYRRAVDRGASAVAVALADALGGGRSLRGAVEEAAAALPGAAGHELRRSAAELRAGAPTDQALDAMRARCGSARVDTLVAACLLQRRAGGDLARLLRHCARAFEDQVRVEDEVRAATAQARFTGLLVVLLPLGGGLLAELASPGWFAGLWSSFLTAWLVGIALVLQVAAALLIRRLGRVRV